MPVIPEQISSMRPIIGPKLTDPAANGDLSEADLETRRRERRWPIRVRSQSATPDAWIRNPTEDLIFQYISGTEVKTGIVAFTGHGGVPFAERRFQRRQRDQLRPIG